MNQQILAHMKAGTTPVHVITDLTGMSDYPSHLMEVRRTLTYFDHPGLGWQVVIGNSAVVNSLVGVVLQIAHAHFRIVPNLNIAVAFLVQEDSSLSDLQSGAGC